MREGNTFHLLERLSNRLSFSINDLGAGILAAMMFLIGLDVVLRYILNRPITGSYEIVEFMLVIVVFFGMAITAVHDGHIRVDILLMRLPVRVQNVMNTISYLCSVYLFAIITWRNVVQANILRLAGRESPSLYIPFYPFLLLLAFGSLILSLVLLVRLSHHLKIHFQKGTKTGILWIVLCAVIIVFLSTAPTWVNWLPWDVSPFDWGLIGLFLLLVFLFWGLPIGFSMALAGFLGVMFTSGMKPALTVMATVPYSIASNYSLSVLPLFILMGSFANCSGIGQDLYQSIYKWLGQLRGGLAMATIGGCASFAAVSGSSVATAATMGMVALPEMKRFKYDPKLATGSVAAGGTLGILIPPSVGFIVYGIITETSIGKLFIAGILPGIMLAFMFMITVYILTLHNASMGPPGPPTTFLEKIASLKGTWGMALLFFIVMGGIYFGVFTPTEAGGIGAVGTFIFALGRRKLTFRIFLQSLRDTLRTTAMIFAIFIGASIFGYFLAMTRLPSVLADYVSGLPLDRYVILCIILFMYIVLGCVMETLALSVLTLPIVFPTVAALGFDPVWFGILTTVTAETGLVTPPVGLNVFVIRGIVEDVPLYTIFRGIIPFVIAMIIGIIILVIFPQITLFLPNLNP